MLSDDALRRKAKEELHENPEHIEAHLESFRRWIQALPHITFPDDRRILLAFLRQAKYIHSKAQIRLDNFCTIRCSPTLGVPSWFEYPSLDDPDLKKYLDACPIVELGRTDEGVRMVLAHKRKLSYFNSQLYLTTAN
ncbi:unnamed protein product [Echinostoma caproni]|uniref:CRAL_TRIO_N domain-containing protein n=1 Tax=Echinostoma caproni TaxID=27848 RepID=A0A183AJ29_9TREM|nr:unnamed protein product [Echinostoma caproni]